jgi:hypothetical protein
MKLAAGGFDNVAEDLSAQETLRLDVRYVFCALPLTLLTSFSRLRLLLKRHEDFLRRIVP